MTKFVANLHMECNGLKNYLLRNFWNVFDMLGVCALSSSAMLAALLLLLKFCDNGKKVQQSADISERVEPSELNYSDSTRKKLLDTLQIARFFKKTFTPSCFFPLKKHEKSKL